MFYSTAFDHFTYLTGAVDETAGDVPAFMDSLKEYAETSVEKLTGKRKRFLRQHFLQFLPYPYDLETYRDYFTDTYESLDTVNRRLLSFMIFMDNA
jgi:hypothetical protein